MEIPSFPIYKDLLLPQGQSFELRFYFADASGNTIALDGYEWRGQIYASPRPGAALIAEFEIEFDGDEVAIHLTDEQVETIAANAYRTSDDPNSGYALGKNYWWSLRAFADIGASYRIAEGKLSITPERTLRMV